MFTVQYYGEIAEKAGKNIEEINLENHSLAAVLEMVMAKYDLKKGDFQIALNHEVVDQESEYELDKNDELALLSAFAGG